MTQPEWKIKQMPKKVEFTWWGRRERISKLMMCTEQEKKSRIFPRRNSICTDIFIGISSICCDFSTHIAYTSTRPKTLFAVLLSTGRSPRSSIFLFSLSSARIRIRPKKNMYSFHGGFCFSNGKKHVAAFSSTHSRAHELTSVTDTF